MLSPTSILALPQPQPVHGAELLPSQDTLPRVGTAPARPARTAPCSAANTYKRRKPTAAPALSPAGALAVPPSRLDGAQRHGDHAIVPVHVCAHDAAPTPASATLRRCRTAAPLLGRRRAGPACTPPVQALKAKRGASTAAVPATGSTAKRLFKTCALGANRIRGTRHPLQPSAVSPAALMGPLFGPDKRRSRCGIARQHRRGRRRRLPCVRLGGSGETLPTGAACRAT